MSHPLMTAKEITKPVKSPKIQALIDKIINDGQDMDVTSQPSFAVKQNSSPAILSGEKFTDLARRTH